MTTLSLYQHVKDVIQGIFTRNDMPIAHSVSQEEADKERERQCLIANEMDRKDIELQKLMDEALENIDGWTA
ncbi:MAG: hypothetical protein IJ934_01110 [Acetobacter sp.]|nr:hypothetical protein [Acetobacter sp.]